MKESTNEWIHEDVDYKLGPAIGPCHLPLQGLSQVLLQLLTFNTPWKEFRVESGNAVLCAQGKSGGAGLQIDISRSWFYEPNSCISSYLENH